MNKSNKELLVFLLEKWLEGEADEGRELSLSAEMTIYTLIAKIKN